MQGGAHRVQVREERVGIGYVKTDGQGRPELGVRAHERRQRLDERIPRHHMHAEREMRRHPTERRRRVHPAPGQIHRVTRLEDHVDRRLVAIRSGPDLGGVGVPRLIAQRISMHRRVHRPVLGARQLQHEHVVHVEMGRETPGGRRGDVGVGLHRVPELGPEPGRELDHRCPQPMQRLEHDGRAVGELPGNGVVPNLIPDFGTHSPRPGEGGGVDHRPVAREPQERRSQPAGRKQLVDAVKVQQVGEGVRVGAVNQQRFPPPVPTAERRRVQPGDSRKRTDEGRAVTDRPPCPRPGSR